MLAARTSLTRSITRIAPLQLPRQTTLRPLLSLSIRGAASQVANRPGSQTLTHASQNIKEEASHALEDMAQAIAGGRQPPQFGSTAEGTALGSSFVGITSAVASTVPAPAMIFGLAGALPYLGSSAATVYYANQAGQAAAGLSTHVDLATATSLLTQAMNVQVTYGAVMLGFLGALHWGMEFAGMGGYKGSRRLMLGIAPTILGWSTLALDPTLALVTQWAGFTGLWYADMKVTSKGWTPPWYSQYRFYLSILVGASIIGSLAGISYLGPSQSHSETLRELHKVRKENEARSASQLHSPVAPGEVGSVSGEEENADAYVLIRHAPEPKEKKEKK